MCIVFQGAIAAASVFASVVPALAQPESNVKNLRPDRGSQQTVTAPEIAGTKCQKVGSFRTAKNVKYQCKKSAQGLRWVITSPKGTPTTTTLAKTTTTCSRSSNSGGPNPDTGGALVAGYQYIKTDSTGIVLAVSYHTNHVGQGVSGGNIWSNNGAWGNVQVGGSIKSENSGNIYYPPGCTPPITTSTVTTTTSSTTTTSTSTTTTTTIKPASSTTVQPIVNTAINSGSASTTTTIDTLFDDGSEQQEVIADITLQKSSNNYLIRITSNQEKTAVEIIARKKGAKNIIWKLVTDSNGAKRILTSRNLKGFTLALRIDGETIDTAKG